MSLSIPSEPTLTVATLNTALEKVKLENLDYILNVPHSKHGSTKQAIIKEFFQNHPAPSWRLIADNLYTFGTEYNGYGNYHEALQIIQWKYLKGKQVLSDTASIVH